MFWPNTSALLLAFALGYLLGSIPFGLIFTRMAGLGDVREIGSGNIGATNVLRTGNKKVAAATLIADVLKGLIPVVIALLVFGREASLAAGLGAFLGHLFPVWLKFRGGKGVATYIGVMLGVNWPSFLIFGIVWMAAFAITRYSSVAALLASVGPPLFLYALDLYPDAALLAVLAVLIWIRHIDNIKRLFTRTEHKIGPQG